MPTEKVTVEEAVQKLSEVSNNNNTRLADVESQLKQIYLDATEKYEEASNNLSSEIINLQNRITSQIKVIQTEAREWQNTFKKKRFYTMFTGFSRCC
jgi:hypothetical protein